MSPLAGIEINQVYRGLGGQFTVINDFYNKGLGVLHSDYENRYVKWGSNSSDFADASIFKLQPALSKLQGWYPNLTVDSMYFPIVNFAHGQVYLEALKERHQGRQVAQKTFDEFMRVLESAEGTPKWKDIPPFYPAIAARKWEFLGGEEPNEMPYGLLAVEIIGTAAHLSKVISEGQRAEILYREPTSMINNL